MYMIFAYSGIWVNLVWLVDIHSPQLECTKKSIISIRHTTYIAAATKSDLLVCALYLLSR